MKKTIIKRDAADRRTGMTFFDVQDFVREADAVGTQIDKMNNHVKVRTTWRGTIRSLQITIEHDEN